MGIALDDTRFPLLVARFGADWTAAEFDEYLAWHRDNLRRRKRFAIILDATRARSPNALERRKQAEALREGEPLLRQYCAGAAFVIPSSVVRGTLTAILWLQPPAYESVVVPTFGEADAWVKQRLPTV